MEYIDIKSIDALHELYGYPKPAHPLISIIDITKVQKPKLPDREVFYRMGFYVVSCKKVVGQMKYGRSTYDFSEGSLAFTAPDQVIAPNPNITVCEGWALYIHPDLLHASEKGRKLTELSYFGYDTNEALHISDAEKEILKDCLQNIEREMTLNPDKHSYNLIISNLELLFAYCTRFYDRQFLTRTKVSNDTVQQFERLLNDYFSQESLIDDGLPDVKYFAGRLNLSANYLTDLLNKYTGKTTQEHIHIKLIDKAKSLLWSTDQNISDIAYGLGFEHPSHFTKLFRAKTGKSPREFRNYN